MDINLKDNFDLKRNNELGIRVFFDKKQINTVFFLNNKKADINFSVGLNNSLK